MEAIPDNLTFLQALVIAYISVLNLASCLAAAAGRALKAMAPMMMPMMPMMPMAPGMMPMMMAPAPGPMMMTPMVFMQPSLPYPYTFTEPFIDNRTNTLHFTKHMATFYTNLNKAASMNSSLAVRLPCSDSSGQLHSSCCSQQFKCRTSYDTVLDPLSRCAQHFYTKSAECSANYWFHQQLSKAYCDDISFTIYCWTDSAVAAADDEAR